MKTCLTITILKKVILTDELNECILLLNQKYIYNMNTFLPTEYPSGKNVPCACDLTGNVSNIT